MHSIFTSAFCSSCIYFQQFTYFVSTTKLSGTLISLLSTSLPVQVGQDTEDRKFLIYRRFILWQINVFSQNLVFLCHNFTACAGPSAAFSKSHYLVTGLERNYLRT